MKTEHLLLLAAVAAVGVGVYLVAKSNQPAAPASAPLTPPSATDQTSAVLSGVGSVLNGVNNVLSTWMNGGN